MLFEVNLITCIPPGCVCEVPHIKIEKRKLKMESFLPNLLPNQNLIQLNYKFSSS